MLSLYTCIIMVHIYRYGLSCPLPPAAITTTTMIKTTTTTMAMHINATVTVSGRITSYNRIRSKTGINNIAKISREFGLGLPTGLNLPGEKGGLIPDRDWKLREKKTIWRPGETIIAGIGQGYVLVTPMQLALMTARIANGGKKIIFICRN